MRITDEGYSFSNYFYSVIKYLYYLFIHLNIIININSIKYFLIEKNKEYWYTSHIKVIFTKYLMIIIERLFICSSEMKENQLPDVMIVIARLLVLLDAYPVK